jgi:hypothetical protein
MANPDARFGLRPVRHISGAPYNGATIRCEISSSYATALFIGDPVDLDTTLTNKSTTGRYPTVIRSDFIDGDYAVGVITSFEPDPDNLSYNYNPASNARFCNVCCDPEVVYQIRGDGGGTLTNVVIGENAVGIFTHSGDTATGLSGLELDEGTTTAPSADATNPMIIVGIADIEDNEWDGTTDSRMIYEVLITNHRFRNGSGYGALGVTAA